MRGKINFKTDLAKVNLAYEKPVMQVYELETEGAILQVSEDATISEYGYEEAWS